MTRRSCGTRALSRPSSGRPRADARETLDLDPKHVARRRIVHGREPRAGAEIAVGQLLEELRRTALGDSRAPVDDQVLQEPRRLDLGAFDRERDALVTPNVPQLLLVTQVPGHDLVAVEPDPDAGNLRRAVPVERDEVSEPPRLDQRAGAVRKVHRGDRTAEIRRRFEPSLRWGNGSRARDWHVRGRKVLGA